MKIKTSEATPSQINYLVAKIEGVEFTYEEHPAHELIVLQYSNDWAQGGPIIERERIATRFDSDEGEWQATIEELDGWTYGWGSTPLVAAMRCYVASKLGDGVEIPEELK